jgi:hypothetical protein
LSTLPTLQLIQLIPAPLPLPDVGVTREQVKELSLLKKSLPQASSSLNAQQFLTNEGKLLAHVLGDGFIADTVFEGSSIVVTANHMVHSLDLLTGSSGDLFDAEEIALLNSVKVYFRQLAKTASEIQNLNNRRAFLDYCSTFAGKIRNLAAGQSLYLPGGWSGIGGKPGHAMLYEVVKQPDGHYTLAIFNSGAGLTGFHDQALVGNKIKFKPVVEYRDIPQEELLTTSADCQGGFFLAALLEPRILPSESYEHPEFDETYIYQQLLGHLEQYRHTVPNQEISGFISAQRSGTCAWKVNNAILRVRLPLKLYKKIIPMIKANTLLEFWRKGEQLIATEDDPAAQLRELYRKSAAQLNRRLAKVYAQLGSEPSAHKEWVLRWTATTMEMLDRLAECDAQLLVQKRALQAISPLQSIDSREREKLRAKMGTIGLLSPSLEIASSAELFPSTHFQAEHPDQLFQELNRVVSTIDTGTNPILVRSLIESIAEKLPLPSNVIFDPYWDSVKEPEQCLTLLSRLAERYTAAAMGEVDPTFSQISSYLSFYAIAHRLTLRIEREEIARAKKRGQAIVPLFQKCAAFVQPFYEDRFLFSDDVASLNRMEAILRYFKQWNSSRTDKLFGATQLFSIKDFIHVSKESEDSGIDLKFYEKLIEEYQLEQECKYFLKTAEDVIIKLPEKLQQSVVLYMRHMELTLKHPFLLALGQFRRLAFYSHLYLGISNNTRFESTLLLKSMPFISPSTYIDSNGFTLYNELK